MVTTGALAVATSALGKEIAGALGGGDRRSVGAADLVARRAAAEPAVFQILIGLLRSSDPIVSMRAADAAEKASRGRPDLLQPYAREVLGLLGTAPTHEVRWHLAQMASRLELATPQMRAAARSLQRLLSDRSVIVRVNALQALVELADRDRALRPGVRALVNDLSSSGAPAVRARCRKLSKRPISAWHNDKEELAKASRG